VSAEAPKTPAEGAGAVGALAFLALRSARNRAFRMAARLGETRYLLAFLAGSAYFGWALWWLLRGGGRAGAAEEAGAGLLGTPGLAGVAPLGLGLLAAVWWTVGRYHRALAFSPAEVDLLFAAPVTRRQLVFYKLSKRQLSVAFTVVFWCLYLGAAGGAGGGFGPGFLLRVAVALWVLVTTMQLHQVGASLVRTAAAEQRGIGLRRHWLPFLLFGAAVAGVVGALAPAVPTVLAAPDLGGALLVVEGALARPAAQWVLLPFRWLLGPLFAVGWGDWLRALAGATLVLVVHVWWVAQSDAAFEEGAAEAGREQAERQRARSGGRGSAVEFAHLRRPPFQLASHGHPAVALLWKNLTLATRQLRLSLLVTLAVVFGVAWLLMWRVTGERADAAALAMSVAFLIAAIAIVAGALAVRYDLRADLEKLDLLRSYPLTGREVVGAEIAASALVLTVVQLVLIAVGLGFLTVAYPNLEPRWAPAAAGAGALLLLPPLNLLLVGAQNALALLFPAWTRLGVERPGGVEQMGALVLTLVAMVVVLALTLLPAALFGGVVGFRLIAGLGTVAWLLAGLSGGVVLWVQVALLVAFLGRRYDALDPVEAGLLR